ncbi:protein C3orf33-like [Apostichopus japonicus]|uniref:protein C3orf33-like n=1 Tax=Stichopus japonicus TaxID=307972 RepID=UPI003AB4E527
MARNGSRLPNSHQRAENGDSETNLLQNFTNFIDRYQSILQIAVTTTAIAGVLTIGRSVRLVTTFRNAKDIPKGFVQRRVHLHGRVEKVEDGVIEVSHLPILPLPWKIQSSQRGSNSYLPLYLAGVSLQSEGQEFLKATLKENPLIWFRLLSVNNAGQIEVVIKMPKHSFSSKNLNFEVLRLGLGKTQDLLAPSSRYTRSLTQKLLKAEMYSERKKRGLWKTPSMREQLSEAVSVRTEGIREWVNLCGKQVYQFPRTLATFWRSFFKRK